MQGASLVRRLEQVAIAGLLLLVFVAVFSNGFLRDSFWLDETVSRWIVSDGWSQVISRSIAFQGQSPLYYLVLWSWAQVFGFSEVALRLPSVFLVVLTLCIAAFWVRRLAGNIAAGFAVVVLLSLDQVLLAMSARPYALALFFSVLALRAFSRLSDTSGQPAKGVAFAPLLLLACAAYAHYLFFACGLVGLLLARSQWRRALVAVIGSALLASPGLWQLSALMEGRDLRFLSNPSLVDFFRTMVPVAAALPVCAALCVVGAMFVGRGDNSLKIESISRRGLFELLSWWLLIPVALWVSALLDIGLFTGRYVLWCMVGAAVLVSLFIGALKPRRAQLLALLVVSVLTTGRAFDRSWQVENWRGAFKLVSEGGRCEGQGKSILLHSGLIELESAFGVVQGAEARYLNAPASVYAPNLEVQHLSAQRLQRISKGEEALNGSDYCAVVVLRKALPPQISGAQGIKDTVDLTKVVFGFAETTLGGVAQTWDASQEGVYVAFPEPGQGTSEADLKPS